MNCFGDSTVQKVSILGFNQSINLYLKSGKAHTQPDIRTDTHTHAQNTTTIYSKRRNQETVEKLHQ